MATVMARKNGVNSFTALADGFEFTEQGTTDTKYYAKAVDTKNDPCGPRMILTASCTNVSALALSTAPAALGVLYTVPDITGEVMYGVRAELEYPRVANGGLTAALEMKVIHGVEQ